jgi:hypothetical protein
MRSCWLAAALLATLGCASAAPLRPAPATPEFNQPIMGPATEGMPCHDPHHDMAGMVGRFPETACAIFGTPSSQIHYVYRHETWDNAADEWSCGASVPWVNDTTLTLADHWTWYRSEHAVGAPAYRLVVSGSGAPAPPALAHGKTYGYTDQEQERVQVDAQPFAFGAGLDGTVVIGWTSTFASGHPEMRIEQWHPGEASTSTTLIPGHIAHPDRGAAHVVSRDDMDLLGWELSGTPPKKPRPFGLRFDGERWRRLEVPDDAIAASITPDGSMLFLGEELIRHERTGEITRRRIGRLLLDGEQIRLSQRYAGDPLLWERARGDLWIVGAIEHAGSSEGSGARRERALLHPCPEGHISKAHRLGDRPPSRTPSAGSGEEHDLQ